MDAVDPEVLAIVNDTMDFARIGEDARRAVATQRVLLPTALPKAVLDVHELFGDVVAGVMGDLLARARALGAAVEIAGHDVPADPAIGHVVERGHPARERQRWLRAKG